MEHLSLETLARLVDEAPRPEEAAHLAECLRCATELDALRAQTRALAGLPEIRPPLGDWEVLEARLRSEGLVEAPLLARVGLARTPGWMRAAAAAALFLGGTLVGAGLTSRPAPGSASGTAGADAALFASVDNVEDAAAQVRVAEERYITALTRYRQLLEADGGESPVGDPSSRFAALQYLVAASQAAVRQAPADPFLNGLLASTLAERDATLHRISNRQDNWF